MREFIISTFGGGQFEQSMARYFNDIRKIKGTIAPQEATLAEKIRRGDQQALLMLVTNNLRFVISVAKQYQNQGVEIGDLINEGNIGLIVAAKKFDETKGFKFISYAVWWIRQAMVFAIAEQSRMVHIPYNYVTLLGKYKKVVRRLEQTHRRKPTREEIAEEMDVAPEKISELCAMESKQLSIDHPMDKNAELTLLDVLSDEDCNTDGSLLKCALQESIEHSLGILNGRDRDLLKLYFGLNLAFPVSLEDIAEKLDLSVEHTRRLKDLALEKLKNSSHGPTLRSFLG